MGNNRPAALARTTYPTVLTGRAAITGTSGTWVNVTPSYLVLDATSFGTDNYGVQDVWADPRHPGHFYAWTCYQGLLRSTDYALTWQKQNTTGDILDGGKNWGSAISADGRRQYNTCGNNANGSPVYRLTVQRSVDDGKTWASSASLGFDPYMVSVDPADALHVVCTMHDDNQLYESLDGGVTWAAMGAISGGGNTIDVSAYVHFVTSSVVLVVAQVGGSSTQIGTFRGVKSGGSWTWTRTHATASHEHGSNQIFNDTVFGALYLPHETGILRSTDVGLNWASVSSNGCDAIVATDSTLYGMRSFPVNSGSVDPKFQTAARATGTSWSTPTIPSGMNNGPKRMAVGTDGVRWVIVGGHWIDGIWIYTE